MEKQIIEINGIKMEVDMRYAKVVENYKIGDNVKVLIKKYSDNYETHPGVIVAFDQFEKLPTITICYVEIGYSSAEVKFISFNSSTKDVEIVHMAEHEKLIDKSKALDYLNRVVAAIEGELLELQRKRSYFLEKFNQHFESTQGE